MKTVEVYDIIKEILLVILWDINHSSIEEMDIPPTLKEVSKAYIILYLIYFIKLDLIKTKLLQ